jgi:CheY-like chemotaxis protein
MSGAFVSSERTDRTVLVIDDFAADRRLVGGLLERSGGLTVEYAKNGKDALGRFESSVPDLVLTDLIMPEMDGLAVVAAIKDEFPLVPVVLMTARGNEDIALSALRAGAAGYVPKRILAQDLVATVRRILAAAHEDRSLSRLMHRMVHNESSFVLHNDPSLIPVLLAYLQQATRCVQLADESDRLRIRLAIEEALLNALYRGNLEIPATVALGDSRAVNEMLEARLVEPPYKDRRIHVSWSIARDSVTVAVRDDGAGFDPAALASPAADVDFDTVFGRGLLIMRCFMDEVRHNSAGNEVTLIKRSHPPAEKEPEPVP